MQRASLQCGMPVRGAHRERLGRVIACGTRHFLVGPRPFSGRRYALRYEDVASLKGGIVRLRGGKELLRPPGEVTGLLTMVLPLDPMASSMAEAASAQGKRSSTFQPSPARV